MNKRKIETEIVVLMDNGIQTSEGKPLKNIESGQLKSFVEGKLPALGSENLLDFFMRKTGVRVFYKGIDVYLLDLRSVEVVEFAEEFIEFESRTLDLEEKKLLQNLINKEKTSLQK